MSTRGHEGHQIPGNRPILWPGRRTRDPARSVPYVPVSYPTARNCRNGRPAKERLPDRLTRHSDLLRVTCRRDRGSTMLDKVTRQRRNSRWAVPQTSAASSHSRGQHSTPSPKPSSRPTLSRPRRLPCDLQRFGSLRSCVDEAAPDFASLSYRLKRGLAVRPAGLEPWSGHPRWPLVVPQPAFRSLACDLSMVLLGNEDDRLC